MQTLPFSDIAEKNVLAACLNDPAQFEAAKTSLTPEHFYTTVHQDIFRTMLETDCNDVSVLCDKLIAKHPDIHAYMAELMNDYDCVHDITKPAEIIIEKSNRRKIIIHAQQAITSASENNETTANEIINELVDKTTYKGFDIVTGTKLPLIENSIDIAKNPPKIKSVLIQDILRKGHKMTVSGPSKAGKSFLVINLALAFANGKEWLGFRCKPSRVLYINFEIDKGSCWERFKSVAIATGITPEHDNLKLWNLRGYNAPIEKLIPDLIKGIGKEQYDVVIIDPLYKMFQSNHFRSFDENGAASMAYLFCHLDTVIRDCGCALIMVGHYSKGMQGGKSSIDRTSGSGVLGRDPDAIISLTELDKTENGYRLESVLREFPSTVNLSLRWNYPLHRIDTTLDCEALKGSAGRSKLFTAQELIDAFYSIDIGDGVVGIDLIHAHFGCGTINTIKDRINELNTAGINSLGLKVVGKNIVSEIRNPKDC